MACACLGLIASAIVLAPAAWAHPDAIVAAILPRDLSVWGSMNSFIGISKQHSANLALVAPGIAEALMATALGLFVAIPAVVIYNAHSRVGAANRARIADASAAVLRLASRDVDQESQWYPNIQRANTQRGAAALAVRPRS